MAATALDGISGDRAAQVAYISRVMHEMDREAEIKYATRKGREEGREGGREEKAKEIAQNLMIANQSIEFITEITGLSIDSVREIAKQMHAKEQFSKEQPELGESSSITAVEGRFVRLPIRKNSEGEDEVHKEASSELPPVRKRE